MRLPVRRALLSVSDKTGLLPLAAALAGHGATLISTGGTAAALRAAGHAVMDVSEVTGFPEILDGRVKTLAPQLYGGILARRDRPAHLAQLAEHEIAPIDLVVVNLYPFEATVAAGADAETCIENIDIGGPALIRAAAKNARDVAVLTAPAQYPALIEALADGGTTADQRRAWAGAAYRATAAYDAAIGAWHAAQAGETFPERFIVTATRRETLRYGENPHQSAALYAWGNRPGVAAAAQLQGKPLSYNNLSDAEAALELAAEFEQPAAVVVKHANPCGVAVGATPLEAWQRALAADPVSAFGGVVALNRELDAATAAAIAEIFTEVIVVPAASEAARAVLARKRALRLLATGGLPDPGETGLTLRSLAGGLLLQSRDAGQVGRDDLRVVTERAPTPAETADLLFAFRVCKHVKSNAIVLAHAGATVGIGAGQMSRVDAARIAAGRHQGPAVVASDAFFPFADGLLAATAGGATAVIQPGGSVRDAEVIAAADARGIAMVFTGLRHFRH